MAPFFKTVDEEVESAHLKFLQTPPGIVLNFIRRTVIHSKNISKYADYC